MCGDLGWVGSSEGSGGIARSEARLCPALPSVVPTVPRLRLAYPAHQAPPCGSAPAISTPSGEGWLRLARRAAESPAVQGAPRLPRCLPLLRHSLTEELLPFLDHSIHDPAASRLARRSHSRKELGRQVSRRRAAPARACFALPACTFGGSLSPTTSRTPRCSDVPHPRMQPSKPLSEEEELQRALQLSMAAAGGAALGGSSYGGSGAGTSGTGHLQDE